MRTWRAMDRAPHDGRWIIAIHRSDPDRRAVIRWDPAGLGDPRPWHVASCQHSYPAEAFTDWMDFPECPPAAAGVEPGTAGGHDGARSDGSPHPGR